MAIEYLQTTNKPIEEIKVEGYKPQFSNDYYWNRVRKPKQENTETEPENESVSQEDTQGAPSGYMWDGGQREETPKDDSDLDFSAKTNLGQRQVASKYLQRKLGLTKEQAAGLVGVWQAESGFNIGAENLAEKQGKNSSVKSNQYGIGIGQWTGDRHDAYMNWINAHGGKNDLKTQLDFAIDEIQNKFGDYLNNLHNAQSVKDATAYTYLQYTGGQHTGIKDTDDLYRRVSKMEAAYAKKHQELYGKSGSGDLDRRVKYAEESIFAKLGAKLPKFQEGNKLGDPLDRPTELERIPAFVEMRAD